MIVVEGIVGSQANSVDYEDSKGNWVQYPPIELVAEAGKGDDGAGIKAMDMTNETSPLSYECESEEHCKSQPAAP